MCALADGVGGMGGGAEASRWVVEQWLRQPGDDALETLQDYDDRLSRQRHGGQSTAILLRLGPGGLVGASVGDSCAWLLPAMELTERQRRKPYLGSGEALPVAFAQAPLAAGRLLLASDGLWKAVACERMLALAAHPDLNEAAQSLLKAARLPLSGEYADDVSLILIDWDFLKNERILSGL